MAVCKIGNVGGWRIRSYHSSALLPANVVFAWTCIMFAEYFVQLGIPCPDALYSKSIFDCHLGQWKQCRTSLFSVRFYGIIL